MIAGRLDWKDLQVKRELKKELEQKIERNGEEMSQFEKKVKSTEEKDEVTKRSQ